MDPNCAYSDQAVAERAIRARPNRYAYVIEDGGTLTDVLVAALRDIDAALGNPKDCPQSRWESAKQSAHDALRYHAAVNITDNPR